MSQSDLARPSLAIVIVSWNSFDVTAPCLISLRSLTYPNYTAIVVDNGSEDDSVTRFENEHSEVILLQNSENRGFTGGNNTGIQYALDHEYDFIMLLNNDTIVTPDFVNPLIDRLENNARLGAIQPKIMYNQERDVIWSAGGKFNAFFCLFKPLGLDEKDEGQYDKPGFIDWVTGCCFLTPRAVVEQVGLLDDKFFIYYEDSDWSFKIKNLGLDLFYEPTSMVYHETGMSNQNRKDHSEGKVSPFTYYQIIRNHIFMVRRYARGINKLGAWTNQVLKLSKYIAYFILRRRFVKLKSVFRAIRDGMTG